MAIPSTNTKFSEIISKHCLRLYKTSLAFIAISDACPLALEVGWCIIIVALGKAALWVFSPFYKSIAHVPNACPTQIVCTGGFI